MRGRKIGEIRSSSRGMYRRSTSAITPKWDDIRTGSDINELGDIASEMMIGYNYKKQRGVVSNAQVEDYPFSNQFLKKLGEAIRFLQPQRAVIFGSAVRKGLEVRDIDILILAESLDQFLWQDRIKLLDLPQGPINDVRLFTPAEFETFYPPLSPLRHSIENQNIDLEEYCLKHQETSFSMNFMKVLGTCGL